MADQKRTATVSRKTQETQIRISLSLDGSGQSKINSGLPFLNHMLTSLSKHGLFDLKIDAKGDLDVDIHHTNEDIGIVLGQAFSKALGKKHGIRRFGFFSIPMDETLVRVSLDFSGRPSFLVIKSKGVKFSRLETYSFHDATEFLRAFSQHAGINLTVEIVNGEDSHHIIEAMFKATAKSLDTATQRDPRIKGVPSTKGSL
ncbi:MAG: imidazoleglycerol-phosphate dehydratase [Omnitrophica bacterium RIFCSPHIGHO2_02_FULL_46_11]|nr:MAG: imidazoleglycerol-phosphate dehydratase [Omnitrophica bacterium RIFCSPHIGHO2_02_FULL_46_11]OGW86315.1 MAG: imidazoleglycerol-phosphate dehydratase [Omnitrophica bacterium RIFCSPLOWO2_01_FULL_45_10b]